MLYVVMQITVLLGGLMTFGQSRSFAKGFGLIVLLAFAAVAGFRGMVGTDTFAYTYMVRFAMQGLNLQIEPGFVAFINLAAQFTHDPSVVVNLFSTLFYGAMLLFMLRATRHELIYLFAFYAPQYFLMYSMNGIRIGLASAFFLLFYQAWTRHRLKSALLYAAIAFSFHFSILLALVLFFVGRSAHDTRRRLIVQVGGMVLLIIVYAFLREYLLGQIDSYANQETFSALAGLSIVIKTLVFLLFVGETPIPARQRYRTTAIALFAVFTSIGVAQFTYAGLRLLDIVGWILPLLYMGSVDRSVSMGSRFSKGLALVGIIGALAVLRNIFSAAGAGGSPFIPYSFIWDSPF